MSRSLDDVWEEASFTHVDGDVLWVGTYEDGAVFRRRETGEVTLIVHDRQGRRTGYPISVLQISEWLRGRVDD